MNEYFNPTKKIQEYQFAGLFYSIGGMPIIYGCKPYITSRDIIRIKKRIWFSQKRKISWLLQKYDRKFSNKEIIKIVKNIESNIKIEFYSSNLKEFIIEKFTNENYFYVVESLDKNGVRNERFENLLITSQERITKLKTVGVKFVEPAKVIVTR